MKQKSLPAQGDMELYIHIPFCARKCEYCDFLSFPPGHALEMEQYIQALICELSWTADHIAYDRIKTVFIGGGTPSMLSAGLLERLLRTVSDRFRLSAEAEVTMEANPGTLGADKLAVCRSFGVNRLSIGLQSVYDARLKELGRIHTYEEFLKGYYMAREYGFENINIDLISAIPGLTVSMWEETLKKVIRLAPEHISAYSLMLEEGTPFYDMYVSGKKRALIQTPLPSSDEEDLMYEITQPVLESAGYRKYEISNYALPGKECRHNIGYWRRTPYYGAGLGAASLIGEKRFKHTSSIEKYMELFGRQINEGTGQLSGEETGLFEEMQVIGEAEQMSETMLLGLRMTDGINGREFEKKFGRSVFHVFGEKINGLLKKELLEIKGESIRMTKKGMELGNIVFMEFI